MRHTFLLSTAISRLQNMTNVLKKLDAAQRQAAGDVYVSALADLIVMTAPFAPMFCSEMWKAMAESGLQNRRLPHAWVGCGSV